MNTSPSRKIYNLIILDESGSMESIKHPTIQSFNEVLQTIRTAEKNMPDLGQYVLIVSFNSSGIRTLVDLAPAAQAQPLTAENYQPTGGTPLYDAMGASLNRLRSILLQEKDHSVLVTVLTDGEENSSREYRATHIRALVDDLKKQGWVFTYMGTDHDVTAAAKELNIDHYHAFDKLALPSAMSLEKEARMSYYKTVARNESLKPGENYFKPKTK